MLPLWLYIHVQHELIQQLRISRMEKVLLIKSTKESITIFSGKWARDIWLFWLRGLNRENRFQIFEATLFSDQRNIPVRITSSGNEIAYCSSLSLAKNDSWLCCRYSLIKPRMTRITNTIFIPHFSTATLKNQIFSSS